MTSPGEIWSAFENNDGWDQLWQHVRLSVIPLAIAVVIGLALGVVTARAGRVGTYVINASAFVARMVPTFAVMAIIMAMTSVGFTPAAVGLVLLAVPTVLLNTATGIRGADPAAVGAAHGMGFTRAQVLTRVELPLALPLIMSGIRSASVMIVATAALAGVIGAGGLGVMIVAGFSNNMHDVLLAGAIPVTLLALAGELLLVTLQRLFTPKGLRRRRTRSTRGIPWFASAR